MDPVSPILFTTERLYTREFTPSDAEAVYRYASSLENAGFLPFCPESREDVGLFIERRLADQIADERSCWDVAVCLKETDEFLGSVSLALRGDGKQAEIGWILDMRYWHNGYALEAARGMLRFGFLGLELHRIYARCDDKNSASYRLMERLGMRREAHFIKDEYTRVMGREGWRSHYIYAMLEKEYLSSLPDGFYSPDGK
jgi:RimJ/RimL family protein N-acetyltransferase